MYDSSSLWLSQNHPYTHGGVTPITWAARSANAQTDMNFKRGK